MGDFVADPTIAFGDPDPVLPFRPGIDRSQALADLRFQGWTDIFCVTCGCPIGRTGLWKGRPYAMIPGDPNRTEYTGGRPIPLCCPGCRRRYDGHTANSLVNRVRRHRCDVLEVPY